MCLRVGLQGAALCKANGIQPIITSGIHHFPVFKGRILLKLGNMAVRVSPERTRSVMSEERNILTREIDRALSTVDGINMPVQDIGAEQNRARQLVHDGESDAVKFVAEPNSQVHLRRIPS